MPKGKGKKGKNDYQKGRGKDAKGKRKEKESRKERKVVARAKVRARPPRSSCGSLLLWEARAFCSRLLEKHYSTGCKRYSRSSSGGASVTTHTVGQQQANVTQAGCQKGHGE